MIALSKFLQPITLARKPLQNYQAYLMDGISPQPDMKKDVGLGTCNCCDYFLISNGVVVLIEETRLLQKIEDLKNEYNYLRGTDQMDFIKEDIRRENWLKAYGSMLVLCRLVAVCKEARNLLGTKKYKFWLVVSDTNMTDAEEFEANRIFDHLKDKLYDLKSLLSGKIVADVEILPSHVFVRKLPKQAPFFQLTP